MYFLLNKSLTKLFRFNHFLIFPLLKLQNYFIFSKEALIDDKIIFGSNLKLKQVFLIILFRFL